MVTFRLLSSQPHTFLVIADDDWTFFEHTGLHYRHFESTQSWTNALCSCLASAPPGYTGNLASVHDNITNTFVTDLAPGRAWLGGYQNGNGDDEPWLWSDGSAWDFTNWLDGEPNSYGGSENHLEVNYKVHGTWNDAPWDGDGRVAGYVCQYEGKNDDMIKI